MVKIDQLDNPFSDTTATAAAAATNVYQTFSESENPIVSSNFETWS